MDNCKGMHMTELGIYADTLCIIGAGVSHDKEYIRIRKNGKQTYAHRAAWEQSHGPIPAGMMVLHRCDNPPCVNVDHLFLGTARDNMLDMVMKGRNRNASSNKTSCPKGHLYDSTDARGHRTCRICVLARKVRYNAKRKAARGI